MNKIKKLGAFGGVFIPSILTILGVIMYMRLPWIVGQSGLFATLAIILVAHIISITTGLSISSIATDKKVEAGGTYYMISRSLGLSIGGTLGLALFVGLSFSVSLYLIGFSEAFLSFFGMDTSLQSIRQTGVIVLSCVTIITFISTKLAIRTQYFILTAMILSLLSIFFGEHNHAPATPMLSTASDALPWIVLFGIFFPAVTGFEAGVSMSGDLTNPKKAIPRGTISAIFIGLVVYVILAFFFSYTVSSDQLRNNPNVLFDISRFRYLVIAGIWGATLSSALGSILAAPRILQAISIDKITPRFFGKGYGQMNEPRNALLLSFVIAFAGIMIGELNVIARIVTIFFIITYGFLNLSCFIESWASSDFRPSFKIPSFVSIIGAVACFIVMIQLDLLAMIGATIILTFVFFYIKRKELVLHSGDTWSSVWVSIVKSGLLKLKNNKMKVRNWRPNIILFSGGIQARPYLTEIGTELIGKLGILTEFELIQKDTLKTDVEDSKDISKLDIEHIEESIFRKKVYCSNIYNEIENISQIYGFSGIEPNSVMLGFPKSEEKISEFRKLNSIFKKIDYNAIFIKYNKNFGYRNKKNIHLWWEGESNFFYLAISLLRIMSSGFKWRSSKITLYFINSYSISTENILQIINNTLSEYRVQANIEIIDRTTDNQDLFELMQTDSANADLIICEYKNTDDTDAYPRMILEKTIHLPTLMMLQASSTFEKVSLFGKTSKEKIKSYSALTDRMRKNERIQFPMLNDIIVNEQIERDGSKLEQIIQQLYESVFIPTQQRNTTISNELQLIIEQSFEKIVYAISSDSKENSRIEFLDIWNDMLLQIRELSDEMIHLGITNDRNDIQTAIQNFVNEIGIFKNSLPDKVKVFHAIDDYAINSDDKVKHKVYKYFKKIQFSILKKRVYETFAYKKAFQTIILPENIRNINTILIKFQNNSFQSIIELRKIFEEIRTVFYKIESDINQGIQDKEHFVTYKNEILQIVAKNDKAIELGLLLYKRSLFTVYKNELSFLINTLNEVYSKTFFRKKSISKRKRQYLINNMLNFSDVWKQNTLHFAQQIFVEISLQSLAMLFKEKIYKEYFKVFSEIQIKNNEKFDVVSAKIQQYINTIIKTNTFDYDIDNIEFMDIHLNELFEDVFAELKTYTEDISDDILIVKPDTKATQTGMNIDYIQTYHLNLKKHVDYFVDGVFYENMELIISKLNDEMNKKSRKINNLLNLSKYNIDNIYINDNLSESDERKNKISYLTNLNETFSAEKQKYTSLYDEFTIVLSRKLKETFEQITLEFLFDASYDKKTLVKVSRKKQMYRKANILKYFNSRIQHVLETIIYSRSKGILLAKKITTGVKEQHSSVQKILHFVEQHSPSAEIMEKLPFYYKNLFNNKFTVNQRFWVGRSLELQKADIAITHYKNGSTGAILVLGERNSGKTSLSNYIAQHYFDKERIFQIHPLRQGSCDINDFTDTLISVTQLQGSAHEIMQQLPNNSVIIINDLALWWERSENGFVVLNIILELINTYSYKCLFIINSNIYAYTFLNRFVHLSDYCLDIIRCEPLSTFELRQLILQRHQSSELKFRWGKIPEYLMIELRNAQLFNAYFDYSGGVIGTALNAWISNIKQIKDNEISIQKPPKPQLDVFDSLTPDIVVILVQFVLHRRLNKERLVRIMKMKEYEIDVILEFLLRTKLIIKLSNQIYMLNSFIEPHLVTYLNKKEII